MSLTCTFASYQRTREPWNLIRFRVLILPRLGNFNFNFNYISFRSSFFFIDLSKSRVTLVVFILKRFVNFVILLPLSFVFQIYYFIDLLIYYWIVRSYSGIWALIFFSIICWFILFVAFCILFIINSLVRCGANIIFPFFFAESSYLVNILRWQFIARCIRLIRHYYNYASDRLFHSPISKQFSTYWCL